MRCVFLPPYSPDLNPIELTFSFMKYNLRRNGQYVRMIMTNMGEIEIHKAILEALLSATPQHAFGWYKHCGYV
jgi:transposase